jgi:hypothetical protein
MRPWSFIVGAVVLGMVATAPPADAARGTGWVQAPISDQKAVVKVINAEAKKRGADQHGLGCYSIWALKGHRDLVTVNFKPNVSPAACGDTSGFGIQVFRKVGGKWTRVATPSGPAGSACRFVGKPSAATKRLVISSGVCR